MTMLRSFGRHHLALLALLTLTPTAAEAIPNRCESGSGYTGYWEGYNLEHNLLDFLWRHRFDCNRLEDFIRAIDIPGLSGRSPSRYLRCRNAGISDAIHDAISERQAECVWQCAENGSDIGELHGEIYCNVTQEYAARALPLPLCSVAAQQSCRASLYAYVENHCPNARDNDPSFETYVDLGCAL